MAEPTVTPVSMLSGFLGSGKTTMLRYLLENTTDKIACIVNDVASINVDAKLIRNDRNRSREETINSTADLTDTIELANGCACCNLQDELFASFEQVIAMGDKKGVPYDRIVLENSGIAEPLQIRDKFAEAAQAGHPLMSRLKLETLITVVDAGTFLQDYASKEALAARPDLGDGGNLRPVVDLLVEQVECADFVILNKTDRLDASSLEQLKALIKSLNPIAQVVPCLNGQVPLDKVFGKNARGLMAKMNIEGQHRGAVAAALELLAAQQDEKEQHHEHKEDDHDHHHHDDHSHEDCKACQDEHDHSHHDHDHSHHDHEHSHDDCKACQQEHDHSHHDHEHSHEDCKACEHDHEHHHEHHGHGDGHKHAHEEPKGHSHAHTHHKQSDETRAATRFGIRSFVYSRRRPFHPTRLRELVLKWLPVTTNKALEGAAPEGGDSPIKQVVRSKGFMWMSNSHTTAYYWSHAGGHFEIRDEGDWWAAVPDEDWPADPQQLGVIGADFDKNGPYGDRRQEIVFIGVGMKEEAITQQLDQALLTDDEVLKYAERWSSVADPTHTLMP